MSFFEKMAWVFRDLASLPIGWHLGIGVILLALGMTFLWAWRFYTRGLTVKEILGFLSTLAALCLLAWLSCALM